MSFSDVSRALAQPVRFKVLLYYLVRIGLVIIALRVVPFLVAWLDGNRAFVISELIVSAALLVILLPLLRIEAPEDLRDNEAMVIIVLSFFLAALSGSIPFIGEGLSWIDALFEAVSGVTTTGLSTISGLHQYSTGFLFARAWMQWYGGLGIVVFSIALLFLNKGIAARRLTMGDIGDNRDILGDTRIHSVKLLIIYSALTIFWICILLIAGVPLFSAATHVLAGISTGGFSIYDDSLAAIDPWSLQLLVMLCCLMGAVSLPFYYRLFKNGVKELLFNLEVRSLLILSLLFIGLLYFFVGDSSADLWMRLEKAVILGLSAQTTTGFTIVDVKALNDASKLSLIFAMTIGGSIGSTAGGLKILRLLIV
ncbi:MAG: TrkH family potassium uptake protein, partial [Gammaproteobacteria bacterium]